MNKGEELHNLQMLKIPYCKALENQPTCNQHENMDPHNNKELEFTSNGMHRLVIIAQWVFQETNNSVLKSMRYHKRSLSLCTERFKKTLVGKKANSMCLAPQFGCLP